jgi:hypothetical protein
MTRFIASALLFSITAASAGVGCGSREFAGTSSLVIEPGEGGAGGDVVPGTPTVGVQGVAYDVYDFGLNQEPAL